MSWRVHLYTRINKNKLIWSSFGLCQHYPNIIQRGLKDFQVWNRQTSTCRLKGTRAVWFLRDVWYVFPETTGSSLEKWRILNLKMNQDDEFLLGKAYPCRCRLRKYWEYVSAIGHVATPTSLSTTSIIMLVLPPFPQELRGSPRHWQMVLVQTAWLAHDQKHHEARRKIAEACRFESKKRLETEQNR